MIKKSTNKFTRKKIPRGKNYGWSGENIVASRFGTDKDQGKPFGIGEFGGIDHFKK